MLSGLLRAFHDVIFPPHCLSCERQLDSSRLPLFCSSCAAQIRPLSSPMCLCCGTPFVTGEDHLCGACLSRPPAFERCRSLFHYEPPVSSLLVLLKFSGRTEVLPSLRQLIVQNDLLPHDIQADVVVPVPLHLSRLRQRGFNQAALLARFLFRGDIPLEMECLVRHKDNIPQTKLSGRERRNNLKRSFSLQKGERLAGKRVLLIDDVFTTGSTVEACCRSLRTAKPARIEVLTLARSTYTA